MTSLRVLRRNIALLIFLAAIAGCDLLKLGQKDNSADIPPIVYKDNPDFIKGSVIVDSFVKRVWGGGTFEPLQTLKDKGLEWVRVGVTTVSSPQLAAADPSTWSSIAWDGSFWSSREMAGQILTEAKDSGCKLDVFLFFSDRAAFAFEQNTPSDWGALSDVDLEAKIETSAYDTAAYFHSLGLAIDLYEIGNEIDFGILNKVATQQISVPSGTDMVNKQGWLEDNVWKLEVPFLKAAIRGIERLCNEKGIAIPKFGLHIAGFGYSVDNNAAQRFFKYMIDQGVDYDIAELSYPYMFGGSDPVDQPYFMQPEFYQTLDYLKTTLGKEVFIAEFSYPAHPVGITKTPSQLYPYSEVGQRDFIEQFLKVARSYADGAFYFYPDYYPGCDYVTSGDDELESSGLFADNTIPNLGMEKFK